MRSRGGDQINAEKEKHFQPNQFLDSHVLRSAYMQVVQQKCLRAGIDSVHKELGMLSVVAAGARCLQEKWVKNLLEESIMGPRRSVFINRFYDSTPWHVSFGRLQQQLMPLARYFWWNEAEDRWVVMNFDEYKKKYPCRYIFQTGTLDVMASSVEVSWVLPSYEACGARLMLAPQIVER
jgi:hypothetical protein